MYRTRRKSGFTLVEILIVVIILGILAAIVIPQFTNASQDARKSNLASQVQTLKSQIELYKLQHKDAVPDLENNWDKLVYYSDINGDATGHLTQPDNTTVPPHNLGPYMQAAPTNPLTASSGVVNGVGTGKADGTHGWTFDPVTGVIHGIAQDKSGNYVETDDGINDVDTGLPIPQ
jgi:general secretion pathway protein G